MIRLAFNELSLIPLLANREHASQVFEVFFNIIDEVNRLKIGQVRIVANCEFFNESICQEYYSVKDWLKKMTDKDKRSRYLGYYLQEQILSDNPDYSYNGNRSVGFGYAYENKTVSISFDNSVWSESEYFIERLYLTNESNPDLITSTVSSRHCPSHENVLTLKGLLQEYHDLELEITSSAISSINDVWTKRESLFSNLIFTENVRPLLISHYNSLNDPNFKKVFSFLKRLQKHLEKVERGEEKFGNIPADISNEGEATLNKYSEERKFILPDSGISKVFSLHVKLGGSVRVYLCPHEQENKFYVGYIGPHLKVASSN